MAPLHLPPPVRKLFGDHRMTARPAIVEPVARPLGVCGPRGRDQQSGEVFVARATRAVVARVDACPPRGAVQLEFTAPPARDVDHLCAKLRRGHDRCGKPVQAHGLRGLQCRLAGDHAGCCINPKVKGQRQPLVRCRAGKPQPCILHHVAQVKHRAQRRAIGARNRDPRLPRKATPGFGAQRQIRGLVQHAAGHVDGMGGADLFEIFAIRQRAAPIDHLRQAVVRRGQNKRLVPVIKAVGLCHNSLLYCAKRETGDEVFLH